MAWRAEPGGPLGGLRVVDLSPDVVGAQASQTLADFGAEVIWVEPPGGARQRARAAFPFLGRGKHSLVADLRRPEGVARVRELAEAADVVIETFRPGVADRLGVGYGPLAAANPGLVYTSITGFGRHGPWAQLKGYEGVVAAVVGLNGCFSELNRGGHPPFVTVPWCSFAASQTALHGILAALLEREHSGHGQWVETNLAQALTIHEGASSSWYGYLARQRLGVAEPTSPPAPTTVPARRFGFRLLVAQTKDGRWLQFAQNRAHLFDAFLRVLGLDHLQTDPKWQAILEMIRNNAMPILDDEEQAMELLERMHNGVRERTLVEWENVFAAEVDVFAELYRRGPEVLDHPQLVYDQAIVEMADPERGRVRQPGPLVDMKATPGTGAGPAPALDDGPRLAWESPTARPASPAPGQRLVLQGITVMELAVQYAAPYGVTLLADLGARVIKIEQLEGDTIRRQQMRFPEAGGGKVLQGKESVAVDIRTPDGLQIVHQLAARVDAVVNGFRPGAARRGHFDADTLRAINPELLYVSAAGYGTDGPCADRAAFATSFGAAGGIAAAQLGGLGAEDPTSSLAEVLACSSALSRATAGSYASADGIGALGVTTGVLLGLLGRQRGGGGQHVVSSMLLSTAHAMADHVVDFPGRPAGLDPGSDRRGPTALYRIYDSADGWVFLAAPQDKEWAALAAALAPYADLGGDARFATPADRAAHDAALGEILAAVFARRPKAAWQADLTAADVACVAVTTDPPEALLMSAEYGRASGYLSDVTHPVFGTHPRLAPVVRFSRSATRAQPGGLCGDATDTVLAELGYPPEAIADLHARHIVG